MKKIIAFLFLISVFSFYCYSQTANSKKITVEITNIVVNGGKVYLAIFSNAEEFRKEEPYAAFELEDSTSVISKEVTLPYGEYVISAFQDANNSKKLEYGLFGVPKELVAISNYFGKGLPSRNFDKQKITVNNAAEKVTIGLYKF